MAKGKTQEDVFAAANALLMRGERPTVEKVRAYLGGGSPNTITPHLDAFYRHVAARLAGKPVTDLSLDMPIPVARAAEAIWKLAQQEAGAEYDRKLGIGLAGARAAADNAMASAATAHAALAASEGKVLQLLASAEESARNFAELRQQLASATAALDSERRDAVALREQLLSSAHEINQVRADCQAEIQRANERSDAASRRASLLIEADRSARSQAEHSVKSLRRQLDELTQAHLASEVASAEKVGRLESECERLRRDHSSVLDQLQKTQQSLSEVTSELNSANARIKVMLRTAGEPETMGTSKRRRKHAPAAIK